MDGTVSRADEGALPWSQGWALRMGERELLVGNGAFVLGRGSNADLQLDDESVSRRHALFRLEPELGPSVEDLGSRNGTFVNERRIAGRVQLAAGDRVALGGCRLELISAPARRRFASAPITRRLPTLSSVPPRGPLAALSPR